MFPFSDIIPQQTDNRAHAPYPANGTVVRPTQYQTTPYPQGYDYRQPVQNGYPYPAAQYPQGVQPVRYGKYYYYISICIDITVE